MKSLTLCLLLTLAACSPYSPQNPEIVHDAEQQCEKYGGLESVSGYDYRDRFQYGARCKDSTYIERVLKE